jgi:hypothetical protein
MVFLWFLKPWTTDTLIKKKFQRFKTRSWFQFTDKKLPMFSTLRSTANLAEITYEVSIERSVFNYPVDPSKTQKISHRVL